MYTTITELLETTLTETELIHLLNDANRDIEDIDLEDPADPIVVKAERCINKGDDLINAYLRTRYTIPIAPPIPGLIKSLSQDFAIYHFHEVRHKKDMPEDLVIKYKDNMKVLNGIQKGEVNPGIEGQEDQSDIIIKTSGKGKPKIFTDDMLSNF